MTDDGQSLDVTAAADASSPFDDGTLAVSDGTIVGADDVATSLLQAPRSELLGEPLSRICPRSPTVYDADRLMEAIDQSVETGDSFVWVFDRGPTGEVTTEVAARRAEGGTHDVVLFVRGTPSWSHRDWSVRPVERLHDVATQLESCVEPEAVYDLTVSAATDILDFDTSTVSVAEGRNLVTKASTSDVAADLPEAVPDDYGLAGRTYQTGRSFRVDDVHTFDEDEQEHRRHRSVISVPIDDVGVFQASATAVGAFSERDLELAELLAGHAADALERIRSVDALRENRKRIARLHDVADEMVTAETEWDVFELAVDAARELLDFDQCTFLQAGDGQFVVAAASSEVDLPDRLLGTDEGVAGRVYRTGESEIVDDVAVDEEAQPLFGGIVSGITVPVGSIGVFQAFSRDPDAFSEDDLELAELLTAHVATSAERAKSARALERQKTQFSSLVASLPGMVFRTSTDDVERLAFVNDYAAELTGYDPATLTSGDGVGFGDLVHPDDRATIVGKRRTALAEGRSYEATYRLVTADSGERWVRERATGLFTDEAGSATLEGFLTDVTGNRRRAQLEVLNRFLRHNLRNDVQVISGHADILEREVRDERMLDSVRRIQSAAAKLVGHSEKAATLEGLLGSDDESNRVSVDLAAVVRRRVELFEQRPDVDLDVSLPESCRVSAVPVLDAAIREALENALRHGGDPPVAISISLESVDEHGRELVRLRIRDDGPGIPEQDRVAIERRTETALTHSSGLGLWLVKWIVTASGGSLDILDSPDGGTELRMTLRRADE